MVLVWQIADQIRQPFPLYGKTAIQYNKPVGNTVHLLQATYNEKVHLREEGKMILFLKK